MASLRSRHDSRIVAANLDFLPTEFRRAHQLRHELGGSHDASSSEASPPVLEIDVVDHDQCQRTGRNRTRLEEPRHRAIRDVAARSLLSVVMSAPDSSAAAKSSWRSPRSIGGWGSAQRLDAPPEIKKTVHRWRRAMGGGEEAVEAFAGHQAPTGRGQVRR